MLFDLTLLVIPLFIIGQCEMRMQALDHAIAAKTDRVEVEISHKPFINLVWLGSILITLGSGWAAVNRFILYRQVLLNIQRQELISRIQ